MIFDVRTYDISMGHVPEYMEAVREVALPVRERYGVRLAGWYFSDICLLYTSPSPRDGLLSRMPSSA